MQAQATKNAITLKGSTAVVTEFFQFALSSILYQRGVYPPESFEPKKQYGLTVRERAVPVAAKHHKRPSLHTRRAAKLL